jgi:hypothetical protein
MDATRACKLLPSPTVRWMVDTPSTNLVLKTTFAFLYMLSFNDTWHGLPGRRGKARRILNHSHALDASLEERYERGVTPDDSYWQSWHPAKRTHIRTTRNWLCGKCCRIIAPMFVVWFKSRALSTSSNIYSGAGLKLRFRSSCECRCHKGHRCNAKIHARMHALANCHIPAQRENERQRKQGPLAARQLRQRRLPHAAKSDPYFKACAPAARTAAGCEGAARSHQF